MLIAVEGCAHGELFQIYNTVQRLERERNVKVDLLICCGDFQAVRNESDLQCMAVPDKYKDMCSFYKYYSGELKAPILTLFIGGNHEASNYMQELAYGGWVAPNIYYLGYAGVVTIGGIRIAGVSGIYKDHDYLKGHFEKPPYNHSSMRSAYHVRNLEVFRLMQLKKEKIDIFISHDWPRGVYHYGNTDELLRIKPYFREEIFQNKLGSEVGETLLHELKPRHWFAAHLHVKFCATIEHPDQSTTQFMSLDKCLPRRNFLELIDIPHDSNQRLDLCFDPQWLAILKSTNHLLSVSHVYNYMPGPKGASNERWDFAPTDQEIARVQELFSGELSIPSSFVATVEPYRPAGHQNQYRNRRTQQPGPMLNPQTTQFCRKLGIDDPMEKLIGPARGPPLPLQDALPNPDEIAIEDDDQEEVVDESVRSTNPNDVFFIDTLPKRSKLNLPEPQTTDFADLPLPQQVSEVDNGSEATKPEVAINSFSSSRQVGREASPALEEPPVVKKMKRRNQEVYAVNPEDY